MIPLSVSHSFNWVSSELSFSSTVDVKADFKKILWPAYLYHFITLKSFKYLLNRNVKVEHLRTAWSVASMLP